MNQGEVCLTHHLSSTSCSHARVTLSPHITRSPRSTLQHAGFLPGSIPSAPLADSEGSARNGSVQRKPFEQESHTSHAKGLREHKQGRMNMPKPQALSEHRQDQPCTNCPSAASACRTLLLLHREYKTVISGQALSH